MGDVERLPVRYARKIAGTDIAEEAGLGVGEFQRPHIGAMLGPDRGPGLAAVVGAIDAAGAVAVPTGQDVGEGDRVLLVVQRVGRGRQFDPMLVGAGRDRNSQREARRQNRLPQAARHHGNFELQVIPDLASLR